MTALRRNLRYMIVIATLAFAIVWPETVAASGIAFDATGASGPTRLGANPWIHVNAGNILFVGCWARQLTACLPRPITAWR